MKNFFQKTKQRGVALLMVLASIALLSAVVVEFAYNTNVTYHVAMNDLDRVQAHHLAQSGIYFSKLLLKFDKETQRLAKEASKKAGKDYQVPPLYETIPMDTALFRGLTGVVAGGENEDSGESTDSDSEETEGQGGALQQGLGLIDSGGAESFLNFHGDFSSEISEEETKLNLNAFYNLSPKEKSYDRLKNTLYHLLATEEFEGIFEDRYQGAKEMAQNIVDFIDKDDAQNEVGGEERGRETIQDPSGIGMKNGKLLSLDELMMVPGMSEEIFQRLKRFVTVYGSDEKIYLCRAEEPLVQALIISYTEDNPKMEPLKDDNQELLTRATDTVLGQCPNISTMSKELDAVLGVTSPSSSSTTSSTGTTSTTTTGSTTSSNTKKSTSQSFTDLVKDQSNIFTIVGIGRVGESEVKLRTVLDTSSSSARQWKQLYWRVE